MHGGLECLFHRNHSLPHSLWNEPAAIGGIDLIVEDDPSMRIKNDEPRLVATRELDLEIAILPHQGFIRRGGRSYRRWG